MRYHRGIKKFLLPSVILHLLLFSLVILLFETDQSYHKPTASYEIGLIKLPSKKKTSNQNTDNDTKENKTEKIDILQASKKVALGKPVKSTKQSKELTSIIIEDNTGQSTMRENPQVSGRSVSSTATGIAGSANAVTQQAFPDYNLNPKPDYPLMARRRGYEGTVLIRVKVLKNGKVGELDIERSSQYDILDKTALNAVGNWTFVPAKRNGISITSWVTIPVKFELKDG